MGEVTKQDYDAIVIPEIERVGKQHGHIHFMKVMETSVKNFSLGAWLQDVAAGFKHYRGWKKIAIVTDKKALKNFRILFHLLFPVQQKVLRFQNWKKRKNG